MHRTLATSRRQEGGLYLSQNLSSLLIAAPVPPGVTIVFGADDIVERRSGRKNTVQGCCREGVRSSKARCHCPYPPPVGPALAHRGNDF
jgi:hypothetical protein